MHEADNLSGVECFQPFQEDEETVPERQPAAISHDKLGWGSLKEATQTPERSWKPRRTCACLSGKHRRTMGKKVLLAPAEMVFVYASTIAATPGSDHQRVLTSEEHGMRVGDDGRHSYYHLL
ncbi:hypothetical protein O3P69_000593 [Scylla paramamosain]|uniref:Uncharacterized protein n=1 Tax=Scylla paramamosain TaxID=85552 RepID=A0AAW0UQ59_SCYPA